jgi:hypothetical protein
MTTRRQQVTTKVLVSSAIAIASFLGGAAPAGAEEDPVGADPNPFGTLGCGSCRETAPAGSPEATEDIARGLQEGRSAWLPGLPAPTQPRQPLP